MKLRLLKPILIFLLKKLKHTNMVELVIVYSCCLCTNRFHTVAYLHQIWWLEVKGDIDFQFPEGTYSVYFRLHLGRSSKKLGRRVCKTEHIHGWDMKPVKFQLTTSDGQRAVSHTHLDNPGHWILCHVGNFVSKSSNDLMNIKFSLTQIDCTHTKGGLCVDSVLICNSSDVKKEV